MYIYLRGYQYFSNDLHVKVAFFINHLQHWWFTLGLAIRIHEWPCTAFYGLNVFWNVFKGISNPGLWPWLLGIFGVGRENDTIPIWRFVFLIPYKIRLLTPYACFFFFKANLHHCSFLSWCILPHTIYEA